MTLNCDLGIYEARDNFAAQPNDKTAADLMESVEEYWRCDKISDKECAIELRKIAEYLESK